MAGIRKNLSIADRLRSQSVESPSGCIEWMGHAIGGYGKIRYRGGREFVHRIAYEVATGKHPGDMCVCHRCDNPTCINPAHLFLGSRSDNNRDKTAKGRQAKGIGHGLKGEMHPRSRIKAADVVDIRTSFHAGEKQRSIAARYGMSPSHISQVVNHNLWRSV